MNSINGSGAYSPAGKTIARDYREDQRKEIADMAEKAAGTPSTVVEVDDDRLMVDGISINVRKNLSHLRTQPRF